MYLGENKKSVYSGRKSSFSKDGSIVDEVEITLGSRIKLIRYGAVRQVDNSGYFMTRCTNILSGWLLKMTVNQLSISLPTTRACTKQEKFKECLFTRM